MGVGDASLICSVCINNAWAVVTMELSVGLGVFAKPVDDWLEDLQDASINSGSVSNKMKREEAFFMFKDPPLNMYLTNNSSSPYYQGRN